MPNQMQLNPQDEISNTTDNKILSIRKEPLQFLILTNSVTLTIEETLVALYNNGNSRSVHYLINKEGHQDLFALEKTLISFTSGKSFFRGHHSLNQTAVSLMFLNSGNEAYTQAQKDKLLAFLKDFHERHPEVDLKNNLLGLGEVATIEKTDVPEGEGKIFPRHEAPGKIFWQEMAQELAEQGFGLFIPTTPEQKTEVCLSPASSEIEITALQKQLREYGYALEASGQYDAATKAWVTRFNHRYVPDTTIDASLWSKASKINLDNILDYIHNKTYPLTQSLQSSLFKPVSSASDEDTVDASQIQLGAA